MSEGLVFLIDDDAAVRDSLSLLLRSVGLNVIAYANAYDFLEADHQEHPACLVLDVRMPGMGGLQLSRALREKGGSWPIVFITGHGDVPMAVEAMRDGAFDFIQKPFREDELIERVQQAIEQDEADLAVQAERHDVEARLESLTDREQEILEQLVEGHANKVIAINLGISQRTVELHRLRVMQKMQARSLAHLVRMVTLLHT